MFRPILRVPFVPLLLTLFALPTCTVSVSHAQTLIVAEAFNRAADQYDMNGNKMGIFALDTSASEFFGMAFDKGGYLYIATGPSDSVDVFAPNGQKIGSLPIAGASGTENVAFDAAGRLYVTSAGNGNVYQISPSGSVTVFANVAGANGLVFDAAGTLYVSSSAGNAVYAVTPAGAVSLFASGLPAPDGLDFGADGNLYVACQGNGGAAVKEIKRFGPDGTPLPSWTSACVNNPAYLKFGPDGNLYAANFYERWSRLPLQRCGCGRRGQFHHGAEFLRRSDIQTGGGGCACCGVGNAGV